MNTNGMIREIEYLGSNGSGTWINLLNTSLVNLQKTSSDTIEFSFKGYQKYKYGWNNLIAIYTTNGGFWFLKIAEYPEVLYAYGNSRSMSHVNKACTYTVIYGASGKGSKLLVDGETILESSTSPTFYGLNTQYQGAGIFSTNGSSFLDKGSYFYGLTCIKNGVKIIDLVPVRVNQTGYAYDKVSKILYPCSGTGSFVLGPDVAKPVMGLWGMRKRRFEPSDYVQDGLVAMWDGEWKNAAGVAALTLENEYLVDVVGGHNIPLSNTNGKIFPNWADYGAKYIDFDINKYTTRASRIDIGSTISGDEITVESVICGSGGRQEAFAKNDSGHTIYCHNGAKYMLPYNKSSFYVPSANGTNFTNVAFSEIAINATPKTISFVCKSGMQTIYIDGEPYLSAAKAWQGAGTIDKLGYCSYNAASGRCWGRRYNDRVYSLALSAAEIAHNYQIDKARFNLP